MQFPSSPQKQVDENAVAIVRNQDALVERLENCFHLLEPFRFRDLHAASNLQRCFIRECYAKLNTDKEKNKAGNMSCTPKLDLEQFSVATFSQLGAIRVRDMILHICSNHLPRVPGRMGPQPRGRWCAQLELVTGEMGRKWMTLFGRDVLLVGQNIHSASAWTHRLRGVGISTMIASGLRYLGRKAY